MATSFLTEGGIYCYNVMPFGLKNVGATYQRLVNRMFKDQIGRTMEVYVDDMVVKSSRFPDHMTHLEKTFAILRELRMKLNSAKCTFVVSGGKFLGYMVSERGIDANPEKIEAILKLKSPTTVKEVQKLTARPNVSGKLVKWAVELREYDIENQARTSLKGQVQRRIWHPDPRSKDIEIEVAAHLSFLVTNNEAEYEALIMGLELAFEAGARDLEVYTDSQLVALQIDGTYETKEESMVLYHAKAKSSMSKFNKCQVHQIPRCENDKADSLSKFGFTLSGIQDRKITVMIRDTPAIAKSMGVNAANENLPGRMRSFNI
ncbi:uncharacterized protein LOC105162360 [Sesamum indicum]|uniref:Uncharacterized protein LOC105162360 n=1 Tax=Sesamum indicum TaxID=4182 RepID=A0A6I9TDG0_SESIN|nr:uncharacterized protein LOC105162360 [Sesamum indicum]